MKMACQYLDRYFKFEKELYQQALNAIHDMEKAIQEQLR